MTHGRRGGGKLPLIPTSTYPQPSRQAAPFLLHLLLQVRARASRPFSLPRSPQLLSPNPNKPMKPMKTTKLSSLLIAGALAGALLPVAHAQLPDITISEDTNYGEAWIAANNLHITNNATVQAIVASVSHLTMDAGTTFITTGGGIGANNVGGMNDTSNDYSRTYTLGGGFIRQHSYGEPYLNLQGVANRVTIEAHTNHATLSTTLGSSQMAYLFTSSYDVDASNLLLTKNVGILHDSAAGHTMSLSNVTMDLNTYDASYFSLTRDSSNSSNFILDVSQLIAANFEGTFEGDMTIILPTGLHISMLEQLSVPNFPGTLTLEAGALATLDFNRLTIVGDNGQKLEYDSIGGNKAVYTIPEPSTATLSLLALAGLAARRRRG